LIEWDRFENVPQQIIAAYAVGLRLEVEYKPMPHGGDDDIPQIVNVHGIAACAEC
tara:strand:- start:326 stop:490 length:165 start_codon:yes stop_codon:yes gene_type:complete